VPVSVRRSSRYRPLTNELLARLPIGRNTLNRVPTIGPKEQRHFDITYTFLADKSAVDSALQQVQKIQRDRPTEVRKTPLVDLPKN
jgi:hypothetical protein